MRLYVFCNIYNNDFVAHIIVSQDRNYAFRIAYIPDLGT